MVPDEKAPKTNLGNSESSWSRKDFRHEISREKLTHDFLKLTRIKAIFNNTTRKTN